MYFWDDESSTASSTRSRAGCEICNDMLDRYDEDLIFEEWYTFFHKPCSSCRQPTDAPLCGRCQHLNLRHLLFCLEEDDLESLARTPISFGKFQDLGSVDVGGRGCVLCSALLEYLKDQTDVFCELEIWVTFRTTISTPPLSNLYMEIEVCDPEDLEHALATVDLVAVDHMHQASREDSMEIGPVLKADAQLLTGVSDITPPSISPVGEEIRWNFFRDLITGCLEDHSSCQQGVYNLPSDFRLIDVEKRCIVKGSPKGSFVALSYVWGKQAREQDSETGKLTIGLLDQFEDHLPSVLPATIEDAIQICRRLGQRYLWVDRLCIIQDDQESKQHQIDAMGGIFASAFFTIVVAGGDSMHSGICGVGKRRKPSQKVVKLLDSSLINVLPGRREVVDNTTWSRRAWTYQEAVLAHRKLWFTETQIYFECNRGTFSEDDFEEPVHGIRDQGTLLLTGDREDGMFLRSSYYRHLANYNTRYLTNESDIFNAFTGIANSLYEDNALVYGIPRSDFYHGLFWYADSQCTSCPKSRDFVSPSWSWGSLQATIRQYHRYFLGPLTQWSVYEECDGNKLFRPIQVRNLDKWKDQDICDKRLPTKIRLANDYRMSAQLYVAIAWRDGCIDSGPPLPPSNELTFEELNDASILRWREFSNFMDEALPSLQATDCYTLGSQPGVLLGRTQTVTFTVDPHVNHDRCVNKGSYEIRDLNGYSIGIVEGRDSAKYLPPGQRIKFVACSVSRSKGSLSSEASCFHPHRHHFSEYVGDSELSEIYRDRERALTYYDRECKFLYPPPRVNVMLVEENSPFLSRIGIGWVFLRQWAKARPQFENVLIA